MDYSYLLSIAIILLLTKFLGLVSGKIRLPQVVGALLAGIVLGPVALNIISLDNQPVLSALSEIGVVVLMFSAGLETDIGEMKKCGLASTIIALCGVLVPLGGGAIVAACFGVSDPNLAAGTLLQNIFVGVILTATSVSITVETLKEMGKLSTRAGNAILGAALIDDVLGIIALTIITSLADPNVNIGLTLLKIFLFFVFAVLVGILLHYILNIWMKRTTYNLRRYAIVSFALCLIFAYVAEEVFGVANITGAFVAGLVISGVSKTNYIERRISTLSYMLLSPIFFASIGLKVTLPEMSANILIFSLVLLVVAVITKIIGCGLGAKLCRYTTSESIQIGIGMISRGEVALIVADKGLSLGLLSSSVFGPIVIMVMVTTIITPVLLKVAFKDKKKKELPTEQPAASTTE